MQLLIIGIRLLAASFPGAFEELFRQGGPSNDNVSSLLVGFLFAFFYRCFLPFLVLLARIISLIRLMETQVSHRSLAPTFKSKYVVVDIVD